MYKYKEVAKGCHIALSQNKNSSYIQTGFFLFESPSTKH